MTELTTWYTYLYHSISFYIYELLFLWFSICSTGVQDLTQVLPRHGERLQRRGLCDLGLWPGRDRGGWHGEPRWVAPWLAGQLVDGGWDVKNHGFSSISTPCSSGISRVFDMFDVFDWYQTSVDQVFNALNWESWRSWSQVIAAVDCHCWSFCVT